MGQQIYLSVQLIEEKYKKSGTQTLEWRDRYQTVEQVLNNITRIDERDEQHGSTG